MFRIISFLNNNIATKGLNVIKTGYMEKKPTPRIEPSDHGKI